MMERRWAINRRSSSDDAKEVNGMPDSGALELGLLSFVRMTRVNSTGNFQLAQPQQGVDILGNVECVRV